MNEEAIKEMLETVEKIREEDMKHAQEMLAIQLEAAAKLEKEHQEANQKDYEERLQAAQEFDWDKWEKQTGLTRPEEVR
jgi:hypothetical protein